jgi:guanylate kinase
MSTSIERASFFIISGPSGAGKSTIANILSLLFDFKASVSDTTRELRGKEIQGEDYNSISGVEFENNAIAGKYAEHAEYGGNRYGTPLSQIEEACKKGRSLVLDIDVQGRERILRHEFFCGERNLRADTRSIFIMPPEPHLKVLEDRLRKRADLNEGQIQARLARAPIEMDQADFYDERIVNDNFQEAKAKLNKTVNDHLNRRLRSS